MKIDMKNKKVVIGLSVIAVLGIAGAMGYGQINTAQNNYVAATSAIMNIGSNIIDDKSTLIDIEAKIQSLNPDKENPTELKLIIEEMEKANFRDKSKLNENVELEDRFNAELDKIIDIYQNNDEMKNDLSLTNSMFEIEGLNNLIDETMTVYNTQDSKGFNESIDKFPVSLATKKLEWYKLDKFTSVTE